MVSPRRRIQRASQALWRVNPGKAFDKGVAGEIAKNDAKWQYCKLLKDKSHIHKGQRVCSILRTVVTGEQLEHTNWNIVENFHQKDQGPPTKQPPWNKTHLNGWVSAYAKGPGTLLKFSAPLCCVLCNNYFLLVCLHVLKCSRLHCAYAMIMAFLDWKW